MESIPLIPKKYFHLSNLRFLNLYMFRLDSTEGSIVIEFETDLALKQLVEKEITLLGWMSGLMIIREMKELRRELIIFFS